jgi:hypothetical protein
MFAFSMAIKLNVEDEDNQGSGDAPGLKMKEVEML